MAHSARSSESSPNPSSGPAHCFYRSGRDDGAVSVHVLLALVVQVLCLFARARVCVYAFLSVYNLYAGTRACVRACVHEFMHACAPQAGGGQRRARDRCAMNRDLAPRLGRLLRPLPPRPRRSSPAPTSQVQRAARAPGQPLPPSYTFSPAQVRRQTLLIFNLRWKEFTLFYGTPPMLFFFFIKWGRHGVPE
jgi:hypothetical protein